MSETRVVLVKPGDVLIFGNVGDLPNDVSGISTALDTLKRSLRLAHVLIFEADIDLAAVPHLTTPPPNLSTTEGD